MIGRAVRYALAALALAALLSYGARYAVDDGAQRFTVPAGRHRPPPAQLVSGWLKNIYGFSTARTLRWRVVFHRPSDPRGRVGGKVCGTSRTLGWPFRRMRYGRLDELIKPAHEQSDRFSFAMGEKAVRVGVYAYREGRRPYDAALRYADQSQPLATLDYEVPYVFALNLSETSTEYVIRREGGEEVARRRVEHRGVWGWRLGRLMGLYIGGTAPAPRPVFITMERLE